MSELISARSSDLPQAINFGQRPPLRRTLTIENLSSLLEHNRPGTPWVDIQHGPTVTMHSPSPEPEPQQRALPPRYHHHLDFSDTLTRHVIIPNPNHPDNQRTTQPTRQLRA